MQKSKSLLSGGILLSLIALFGMVLSAPRANAESSAQLDFAVKVLAACSLSTTNNSLTKTINPGATDTIGISNIKALCNDPSGFSIYAVGYTDNVDGNNVLSTNISNADHDYSILTGAEATPTTSQWNMTITPDNSLENSYASTIENDFNIAHAIPSTYTKIASSTAVTDQTVGANLAAKYDIYVSPDQPAGTYTGKVKYTLVHPNVSGAETTTTAYIVYSPNATDIRGSMEPQLAVGETNLISPNYARAGYGFAAWNTKADGTGVNFGPSQAIDLSEYEELIDEDSNSITLYAKWVAAETGVTMQTFNPANYPDSTYPINSVIALRDERDNDVYAVAKLADGKWWMIENLRIDGTVDAETMAAKSQGTGGVFTKLPESADSFRVTYNETYPADSGVNGYTVPRINTNNTNIGGKNSSGEDLVATPTGDYKTSYWYSYGNMYSWSAAIASTETYTASTVVSTTSICAKGWHLPIYADDYKELDIVMGGTGARRDGVGVASHWLNYPVNYIFSGSADAGSNPNRRGTGSSHWTANAASTSTNALYMATANTLIIPGNFRTSNWYGFAVRCVADTPTQEPETPTNNEPTNDPEPTNPTNPSNTNGGGAQPTTNYSPSNSNKSFSSTSTSNSGDNGAKTGNTTPLGVKNTRKANDNTILDDEAVIATTDGASVDVIPYIMTAAAGAGAILAGILLIKRRKDKDEEEIDQF